MKLAGEELPELHRLTFWECESGPLAMPPCPPFTAQNACSGRFCCKKFFCISVKIPKGQETKLFS